MAIIYIDPSMPTNGTGTLVNPYNTDAGVNPVAGDTVLYKTNTTKNSRIPAAINIAGSITVGEYGTGAKPIVDLGVVITMTASGTAGIFQYSYGSNLGGNVQIDGVPQKWVQWNTNLATTAASMVEGSFTFDYVNNILYCKPVGGVLTGKVVKASNEVNGVSGSGLQYNKYRNLEIRQASKHGFVHVDSHALDMEGCVTRLCGGYRDTSGNFYAGNGFEIGGSSIDAWIRKCEAYDTFDSAFTSQLYGGQTGAQAARNHQYDDCNSERCGYSAYEYGILDTFQTLNGVWVNRPRSRDAGTSAAWAVRPGKGHALSLIGGAADKGGMDRIYVDSPDFKDSLYALRNSGNIGTLHVTGSGQMIGNQVNRILIEQMGSPNYARTIILFDQRRIVTDGTDNLTGYSDSLITF